MKHVQAIKKIVSQGQFEEAHRALEDLLELGPNNMEALKLRAALFEHVGRFEEEEAVWRRIIDADNEDDDAISYFQRWQLEDREHYYFTDPLPGGGRRFLAYPRALMSVSFLGLAGCVSFLVVTRLGGQYFPLSPLMLFSVFLMLVISPWLLIIYLYLRTLHSIQITASGFAVTTRFRTVVYSWAEIKQIYMTHSEDPLTHDLRLVIMPLEEHKPSLCIDFAESTSVVRARRHLVREIRDHHRDIRYATYTTLTLDPKSLLKF